MTIREILNQLEGLGTEQNRKIYIRHGSGQNTYGVSFSNLRGMAKSIGKDHELAVALWASENVDAQALATMIADPDKLTIKSTELWLKEVRYSLLVGLIAGLVAKAQFGKKVYGKWIDSRNESLCEAGYSLLCHLFKNGEVLDGDHLESLIDRIKSEIHSAPNQIRIAMNGALIAIGIYLPSLTVRALTAAKEIGKLEIDHGETSCKTPDAYTYIQKAVARKSKVEKKPVSPKPARGNKPKKT